VLPFLSMGDEMGEDALQAWAEAEGHEAVGTADVSRSGHVGDGVGSGRTSSGW
jgi:hypothetical protein